MAEDPLGGLGGPDANSADLRGLPPRVIESPALATREHPAAAGHGHGHDPVPCTLEAFDEVGGSKCEHVC